MGWLHTLWFAYAWSSLKSNGPEALVQTLVYGVLASIFIPIIRRWWQAELAQVHARLRHIIHHAPDIPDYPGDTKGSP